MSVCTNSETVQLNRQEAVGSGQTLLVFESGHRVNGCMGRAMTGQFVLDSVNSVH